MRDGDDQDFNAIELIHNVVRKDIQKHDSRILAMWRSQQRELLNVLESGFKIVNEARHQRVVDVRIVADFLSEFALDSRRILNRRQHGILPRSMQLPRELSSRTL